MAVEDSNQGNKNIFGLSQGDRSALLFRLKRSGSASVEAKSGRTLDEVQWRADPKMTKFEEFPAYKQIKMERSVAERAGILNPFFQCHDGIAKAETKINGETFLNFSTYDYLDLNGHPALEEAAVDALKRWGTSASASRLVSGERPPHRKLEKTLASIYDAEDCIAYVSGHATNVSTIGKLFGAQDVIFHDSLSHNSIVMGAQASGAKRISFPHNDMEALERLLREHRPKAQRALIVTEGVFSMDGNVANLPELVRLKKAWGCFLMLDEAHSLGVLGKTGRGTAEHFGIDPKEVDLWMGTLSKTCCGCGGYIAGCREVVELLKFTSPGFVYSVGMSPALAAASERAVKIMLAEPERVAKLQAVSHEFVRYAKSKGLDTGSAEGYAVVPLMLGSSLLAGKLASRMFARKVNVMPIIYPVVEEGAARLRFFLSAAHDVEHVHRAIDIVCEELPMAREDVARMSGKTE
ncbi:MAG: aminotransferase class I/II-fold pyridoxal phosphate-dependent enzyme [Escherichia coli]|nr:aminotransferase class I/II-fold pyridoxal phosphate-dependent enzyme [Escherichia coli]